MDNFPVKATQLGDGLRRLLIPAHQRLGTYTLQCVIKKMRVNLMLQGTHGRLLLLQLHHILRTDIPLQLLAHILQSDGYPSIFIFMLRMDFQIFSHGKVTVFHSSQHLHDIGKEPGIIPDSHKGYQDSAPCQNDQDKTDPDQRRPVQPPEHLTVNHTNIGKIILAGRKNRIKNPIIAASEKGSLTLLQVFRRPDPVPFLLHGIIRMKRLSFLHNGPGPGWVHPAE